MKRIFCTLGALVLSTTLAHAACPADGLWSGSWGNIAVTTMTVKSCRITSYRYQGRSTAITSQTVSGDTIHFEIQGGQLSLDANGNATYSGAASGGRGVYARLTRQ